MHPVRVSFSQGRQQGNVSDSKESGPPPSNDNDDTGPSPLDDPHYRGRLLEHARYLVTVSDETKNALVREVETLDAALARGGHESVRLAAGSVYEDLSNSIKQLSFKIQCLTAGIVAIERVPSLRDAVRDAHVEFDAMMMQLKYARESKLNRSSELDDLRAAVDAIEFAATANRNDELQRISDAMGRILGGVTELRNMGFETGEIQATVDDFISQREKHEFSLLAPVISDDDAKGTRRNKRVAVKKRERLLAEDKWVRRFLHQFWCRYWRNAFEGSLPDEEQRKNVELAIQVIPGILDAKDAPLDEWTLCFETDRKIRERRESSRIRLRDKHVLAGIEHLIRSGGSGPLAVVVIERPEPLKHGDVPDYWTRQRAEAAGLKIAPPRLTLVPPDGEERHKDGDIVEPTSDRRVTRHRPDQ